MKTLSMVSYIIGSILLIISCFTTSMAATWWIGGISVVFLVAGCIFQYQNSSRNQSGTHVNHHR